MDSPYAILCQELVSPYAIMCQELKTGLTTNVP
jgi:hypothetical protein